MTNLIQREILAEQYERAIKRGDRLGASRIWPLLFAATNKALGG